MQVGRETNEPTPDAAMADFAKSWRRVERRDCSHRVVGQDVIDNIAYIVLDVLADCSLALARGQ